MTEGQAQQNQVQKTKFNKFFLVKIVTLITLVIFGYFGFKHWQISKSNIFKKAEIGKSENSDNDIFDISEEYKNQPGLEGSDDKDLSDLTVSELKEKGAEFVYRSLLKNQVQINDLKQQIQELKAEFTKYKSQEKIGKVIFTYIDLRQKLFAGEDYLEAAKNFEMLIGFDENLQNKFIKLNPLLKDFIGKKKIINNFDNIIPELMATKNNNPGQDWRSKFRYYISKIIIIRRVDGANPNDTDGIIVGVEKYLNEENYQEALNSLLLLDEKYHQVLVGFLNDLGNAIEVKKIDQEILNYLKSLN